MDKVNINLYHLSFFLLFGSWLHGRWLVRVIFLRINTLVERSKINKNVINIFVLYHLTKLKIKSNGIQIQ